MQVEGLDGFDAVLGTRDFGLPTQVHRLYAEFDAGADFDLDLDEVLDVHLQSDLLGYGLERGLVSDCHRDGLGLENIKD